MGVAVVPVIKAYVPPMPTPPLDNISLVDCDLCGALVSPAKDSEAKHMSWHRTNGLHAYNCQALLSLQAKHVAARAGSDVTEYKTDPCSCPLSWSAPITPA